MRIISQGGHADFPYEEIALCIACEDIIATHNDKEYLMARYSTMEKAQKAMEMLHTEWADYGSSGYFQFPNDEDVEV